MKTLIAAGLLALMSTQAGASPQWMDEFARVVKSEKSVRHAEWPQGSHIVFWAVMDDNGSRRDGFAEYLCMLRSDAGVPVKASYLISIWDAAAYDRGDFVKIGETDCVRR